MNRKVHGVGEILGELESQVGLLESLLLNYPGTSLEYVKTLRTLKKEMDSVKLVMYGDPLLAKHEFESAPSLTGRLGMVEYMLYDNTAGATKTQEVHLSIIEEIYPTLEVSVKAMLQQLEALEDALAKGPIPYTRNRGLKWKLD
jgi:2-oxoglutarate dehydrogenase complex dehydrogenase (E1) component-like enzyme